MNCIRQNERYRIDRVWIRYGYSRAYARDAPISTLYIYSYTYTCSKV